MGSVAKVELYADWSLLLIFGLIFFSLGAGMLPEWHPDWQPVVVWATALAASVLFFVSVLLHELAHATVGRLFGAPVRRITLFLFGGLAEIDREPPSPSGEFLMAIVGPVTSVVIGILALSIGVVLLPAQLPDATAFDAARSAGPVSTLFLWLGPINLVLGVFNLVPGFPLDGGRALRAGLWWITGDLRRATAWASTGGQFFGYLLIACGAAMVFGWSVPIFGSGAGQGLWLVLIGWFLSVAARMSYQQLAVREAFEGLPVSRVMRATPVTVTPTTSVDALIHDYLMASDQHSFPVVENQQLRGIVAMDDLRKVSRDFWASSSVADIMTPAGAVEMFTPDADALKVFRGLADHEQVPIVDHGRLVGVARRDDLMRWLAVHEASLSEQ